jgi:transcription antitermination factor NusG
MTSSTFSLQTPSSPSGNFSMMVSEQHRMARWYAVYTSARHEKQIAKQLGQRNIVHFCPLQDCLHVWNNRKVKVQLPFFPNYLFVNFAYCDRMPVLQIPGVVRVVCSGAEPIAVPDEQILALRKVLEYGLPIESEELMEVGSAVRIRRGPLEGTKGLLVRTKGKYRLVISVKAIMRSFAIEIDRNDVRPFESN